MTADIRAAAQREVKKLRVTGSDGNEYGLTKAAKDSFVLGAVWAQARVTPTREQIAEVVDNALRDWLVREDPVDLRTRQEHVADDVLALMQELAEGEGHGSD